MVDFTIDAGHGGYDPGANGPTGLTESATTLKLALKVGSLLTANGVSVNYTRTTDTFVGLSERANYANNTGANYFLSIHLNSAGATATGTETYAFDPGGSDERLASFVQSNLVSAIGLPNRGVKFANFAVLRETNMAAVLTEVCFISNPSEESLLKTDAFLTKAATGIAKGVVAFLGRTWNGGGTTPPAKLYRVRKTWADAASQIGAYNVLENAIALCDLNPGYSVFDENGVKVYPNTSQPSDGLYRVRKTWDDETSQVGAYSILENAKIECDKHSGYSVFDEHGIKVYPLNAALWRVRKSWTDAASQVGAYSILDNAKVECDKHPGFSVFDDIGNKVYPPIR
ncbi:N-acetylmuramoyl-L-alanine amidase [Paenibacillus sp. N1-5-1-14]|uniref:N-acetylmuramoyl-L-alanine amidase family protein n=1 Tax=Paenibacillus radicibacter TaxID=2972488 RepID=UPI0021593B53|nr:N-acetylmuramoyl-L-alanine amidase [Paenibacillus radicibacter]MCR8641995.1 N-acetylmuramoyl-L-alanine amidase [Paenibacillus radicibacter]